MTRSLFVVACFAALAGCASDRDPRSNQPSPDTTVAGNPGPPSTASAQVHRRPSIPRPPEGVDAAQFEVLASICAVASWEGPDGRKVGCRSAAPFDGPGEKPDGAIEDRTELTDVCFLESMVRGSFSAPGKEQAVMGFAACGADRVNDIAPGNVVLAERGADGWGVVAVETDTTVDRCVPSKRADRTLLVCVGSVGAWGDGSLWWRFTLDFSKPRGQRQNVFAKLYETPSTSCMMGTDILAERGVTVLGFSNERLADTDGDGDDDLSFSVERAHTKSSPALAKKAEARCKQAKGESGLLDLQSLVGPARKVTLSFEGTPTTLEPTPATKQLLDAWGKEAPEFWWSLK